MALNYKSLQASSTTQQTLSLYTCSVTSTIVKSVMVHNDSASSRDVIIKLQKDGSATQLVVFQEKAIVADGSKQALGESIVMQTGDILHAECSGGDVDITMMYVESTAVLNATSVRELSDWSTDIPSDGDVPVYNATTGEWEPGVGGGGSTTLGGLTDVNTSGATSGDVIVYNGSTWNKSSSLHNLVNILKEPDLNSVSLEKDSNNKIVIDGTSGSENIVATVAGVDVISAKSASIRSDVSVGIGTNPAADLHVYSTGNAEVEVERQAGALINTQAQLTKGVIGTDSNHPLSLKTNSGERLTIDTSGNVGIGTSSPSEKLTVDGNIRVLDGNKLMFRSSGDTYGAEHKLDGYQYKISPSAGNGYSGLVISDNSGLLLAMFAGHSWRGVNNVIIGSKPIRAPHNGGFGFQSYGATPDVSAIESIYTDNNTNGLKFLTRELGTDTERMRIDSSGNVGIGTTSPTAKLHSMGADGSALSLRLGRADTGSEWSFNHAGDDLRIYNTGGSGKDILFGVNSGGVDQGNKVGIGTASPSAKLDVVGLANIEDGSRNVMISSGNTALTGVSNTAVGYQAGLSNTGGNDNAFFGRSAGASNTIGNNNSFITGYAGYSNTTGSNNTAVGWAASYSNITGYSNTAVGRNALYNSTGNLNVAIGRDAAFGASGASTFSNTTAVGYQALTALTIGENNVAVGFQAGLSNTEGDDNVFVGGFAGQANTTGDNNAFVGRNAGYANISGSVNSFLGVSAGRYNTTGYSNTFVGGLAGNQNTIGYSNSFVGVNAGFSNTIGNDNSFVGRSAGYYSTGSSNVVIGYEAGYGSATSDYSNTVAVGYQALHDLTTGGFNTAVGYQAADLLTTEAYNTAVGNEALGNSTGAEYTTGVGYKSLLDATGNYSAALGYRAGQSSGFGGVSVGGFAGQYATGTNNVLVGYAAGQGSSGASSFGGTTAVGYQALKSLTTGGGNTAVGYQAGNNIDGGNSNVAIGWGALLNNEGGNNNTAIGREALNSNVGGGQNVAFGREAGYSSIGTGNVFIGYRSGYNETTNNKLYIANSDTTTPLIYGDFSNEQLTINGDLILEGNSYGVYHSFRDQQYYFDDYNGTKNAKTFLKTSRSDIIKYQPIGVVEYWNGSSWVDATSTLRSSIERLLDGKEDTNWAVPSTYYKFRFTVTASTSWPTRAAVGADLSWTGSNYPGFTMTVEEQQSDSSWVTELTADFTSANGVTNWGTAFHYGNELHTGRGGQQYSTRITIDFDGWTPSNQGYTTVPLKNIFIYSNFSGTQNNDVHQLMDYSRLITAPNGIAVDGDGTTTPGQIKLGDNDSSHYVTLKAPGTLAADLAFQLPTADGTNGQVLQTDGSGRLSFATVSGGGGGGASTESGSFFITGNITSSTQQVNVFYTHTTSVRTSGNFQSYNIWHVPSNATISSISVRVQGDCNGVFYMGVGTLNNQAIPTYTWTYSQALTSTGAGTIHTITPSNWQFSSSDELSFGFEPTEAVTPFYVTVNVQYTF